MGSARTRYAVGGARELPRTRVAAADGAPPMEVRETVSGQLVSSAGAGTPSRRVVARRRAEQLRRALNLAATLPASQVVIIEADEGEQLGTIRAALIRLLAEEPRDLVWGVRGEMIVIGRERLPAIRRNRRRQRPGGPPPPRAAV